MPAPTFVGGYITAFNSSTSPKSSAAFDVAATGDVIIAGVADAAFATSENYTFSNSGTAMTWVEHTAATSVNGSDVFIQTAQCIPAGAQTGITGTITRNTGASVDFFGGPFTRWSNATMTGTATARSTTADTASPYQLSITTLLANSGILYGWADWGAVDHSTRTHLTVNGFTPLAGGLYEIGYHRDTVQYAQGWAYIPDAGAAGAKTVGFSDSAGAADILLVAVEIGGVAGAAAPQTPVWHRQAVRRSATR